MNTKIWILAITLFVTYIIGWIRGQYALGVTVKKSIENLTLAEIGGAVVFCIVMATSVMQYYL